jgi:hypothetical protein
MSEAPKSGFPLAWPIGRPRASSRDRSQFKTTLGRAIADVSGEVRRLGGSALVISSNLELRRDGLPYADSRVPTDPAVAVYFTLKKKPMCFACDRWNRVEENMRAIALTIGALRGIERWGSGSMLEQAFSGFAALPAPEQPWQVLGVKHDANPGDIERAYRGLAARFHPDKPDGDAEKMARINRARDQLLE